jgi:hypothetical protein
MLEVAMQDAIPQVDRIDERSFDGTTQGGQSLEFEDNGFLRMGDLFRNSPMISPIATINHRITLTIPIMLRQMSKKHLPRRRPGVMYLGKTRTIFLYHSMTMMQRWTSWTVSQRTAMMPNK